MRHAGLCGLLAILALHTVPAEARLMDAVAGSFQSGRQGMAAAVRDTGYRHVSGRYWFDKGLQAYQANEFILAERIWLPLARAGHRESRYHLGVLYDQQYHEAGKAFRWYLQAARQGHVDAQHNVALSLARGEGVASNIRLALAWWRRAARQGSKDSSYNLGVIYALGAAGVSKNLRQAEQWWLQAARLGDAMAQYNLGALYVSEASRQNVCKAGHWFRLSSANGFDRAGMALTELEPLLDRARCR